MSPAIEHVVVLMLENRSFDHMLGTQPLPGAELIPAGASNPSDPGWAGHPGTPIPATEGADYVTDPSPGHEFDDVTLQLFGQHVVPSPAVPRNNGFVMSYSGVQGSNGLPVGLGVGARAMACFAPGQLPVISELAQNFTVCDHWYSSVPGPTWPNRFFVHAASSGGHVESPSSIEAIKDEIAQSTYGMRTIFESLEEASCSWCIYYHDFPQSLALSSLHRRPQGFAQIDEFFRDAAAGKLPQYSFIEPRYFDLPLQPPANDMHPPHDVREGERLIAEVYDALASANDAWPKTLLIVLFDEHGGFFDHVAPPRCVSPDGKLAANGFAFDRLGPRVPALLVSPRAPKTIVNATFDHTTIPATLKRVFALPAFLNRRDAAALPLDGLLLEQPRPLDSLPHDLSKLLPEASSNSSEAGKAPLSSFQESLLSLYSALNMQAHTESTAAEQALAELEKFFLRHAAGESRGSQ